MNSETDPSDADITWAGGAIIDCSAECYLVVKDGMKEPVWYIFDLTGWNGTEIIELTSFWPDTSRGSGAISHVDILGGRGGNTTVPEPGTLALLGIGLFSMGLMRRRRTS